MPNRVNLLLRKEIERALGDAEHAVLVDVTGVDAEQTYALRKLLHEREVHMRVVKNSTARLALESLGFEIDPALFEGPVAIAWNGDPAHVAKTIADFRKEHKGTPLKVKGGFLDRKAIGVEQVEALASLPSREQLLSMVVGTFAAPISSFIGVQAAILRSLLYALEAIKEKKGEAA
ncbi:MAG: 50S ribosomal protein L10 [Planctomycetota bacterium]|nr:MAG: 50S ribosomal protein L10 [Planctomycetota bacterium]